MADYIASSQSVAVGGNVVFADSSTGSCVTHRDGSGVFTLHGNKRYLVAFCGNITGTTTTASCDLTFTINGEPIASSMMSYTPATASTLGNVSGFMYVKVPCSCCYTVAVENTGTTAVTVNNGTMLIVRED